MRKRSGILLAASLVVASTLHGGGLPYTVRETVGLVPNVCSDTTNITVVRGAVVWFCYAITNPTNNSVLYNVGTGRFGMFPTNSTVGPLGTDYRLLSAPVDDANSTVVNPATWVTYTPVGGGWVPADVGSSSATINLFDPVPTSVPALAPAGIVALGVALLAAGFVLLRRVG
jgi:hypothetical protein